MLYVDRWIDDARSEGCAAARAAASWIVADDPSQEALARILALMDDGDPRIDDYLPCQPNLSGEYADDRTPLSLAREITGDDDVAPMVIEMLADAFEEGVSDTFMGACESELRRRLI